MAEVKKSVLDISRSKGFPDRLNDLNCWQILPLNAAENWMLIASESHWVLHTKGVPQIRFGSNEAIAFLEDRLRFGQLVA